MISTVSQKKGANLSFARSTGWSKNGYQIYFWDNFGNSAPILTILSLIKAGFKGRL